MLSVASMLLGLYRYHGLISPVSKPGLTNRFDGLAEAEVVAVVTV
jgi:hypothetical protein